MSDDRPVFALVNHHRLSEPVPQAAYDQLAGRLEEMRELGLRTFQMFEVAEDHLILVATFDSEEAVDIVSERIGSPWLREWVVPRLSEPTEQHFGRAVCSLGL